MKDSDKVKWVNDVLQALTTRMTTAETIVYLGKAYDICFMHGAIREIKDQNDKMAKKLADLST